MTEKLSKAFFGAEDDPSFDLEAARAAYQWVMEHDYDEASMALRIALFEETTRDLEKYGDYVREEVTKRAKARLRHVRKAVAKRHMANPTEETSSLLAAIAKADAFIDPDLSVRARRQWRSKDGRFRVMSTQLSYGNQKKPLSAGQAKRLRIEPPTDSNMKEVKLSGEKLRNYQEAYAQVAQTLRQARAVDPQAILQIRYEDGTPSKEILVNNETQIKEIIDASKFRRGTRISAVEVQIADDTARGAAFDVMGAMRVPSAAASTLAGSRGVSGQAVTNLREGWTNDPKDDFLIANPSQRAYRRLEASSEFLDSLLPDEENRSGLQRKLALAFGAGKWAGKYGTDVEQVIGPTVRRSAYRYRGTEKKPEPGIQNAINSAVMRNRGDMNQARAEMIYGRRVQTANGRGGIDEEHRESPIVQYFTSRLPKTELSRLQNKAGATPPSQGIIIDRGGQVSTEAVGYGDDWYLPFDLKNLGRMRGGEYIRTRTFGGPTTEDVYAGMVGGARAMTVVSNSGVFTVEFDDTFRGSRRYNDNAARMVKRYGMLLDAVKNGDIVLEEIPQDRLEELYAEAEREYGPGPESAQQRKEWVNRQKKDFQVRRQMSAKRREAAAEDFLRDRFSSQNAGWEAQVAERVQRKAQEELRTDRQFQAMQAMADGRAPVLPDMTREQARDLARQRASDTLARVSEEYRGAERAASAMFPEEFRQFMQKQERSYEANLRQLTLDGDGYAKALEALREQFPYYIKSVQFRRLDKAKDSSVDTGYIKPYYIRPEAALVGYYDETIMGRASVELESEKRTGGKMTADRAYYQNNSRAFRNPNPRSTTRAERVRTDEEAPAETSGAARAERPAETGLTEMAREQRAVSNLVVHARENGWNREFRQKFLPNDIAKFPLLTGEMSDDELTEFIMESPANRARFERELQQIDQAMKVDGDRATLAEKLVFPLDSELRRSYERRGEAPETVEFRVIDFLRPGSSQKTYDFGRFYESGRASRDYERVFSEDSTIVQAKALSGVTSLEDPDYEKKIADGVRKVRERMIQVETAARNPAVSPPRGIPRRREVEDEAQGMAKLRQLRRAYSEAKADEVRVAPQAEAEAATQARLINLPDQPDGTQVTMIAIEGPKALSDLDKLIQSAAMGRPARPDDAADDLIKQIDEILAGDDNETMRRNVQ